MPTDNDDTAHAYPIRAVERVCTILNVLGDNPEGETLAAIAESTGLPKASAFRYLWSLETHLYVEKDPESGTYTLGPAFRTDRHDVVARLIQVAEPYLERLRDATHETANLGVLERTEVVHHLVCESTQMMRLAARVGERGMVHATALGKATASLLPEHRVRAILASAGMPALTDQTITEPDAFVAALEEVHESGYAVDDAENQLDGRCVAVAIPGLAFPAGISVSAPITRLPAEGVEPMARHLVAAASAIGAEMAAQIG